MQSCLSAGSGQYFPPLAPVGAPAGDAAGAQEGGSLGISGADKGQGEYGMGMGAMRPLNPAEVQAASSLSSAQAGPETGSSGRHSAEPTRGEMYGRIL